MGTIKLWSQKSIRREARTREALPGQSRTCQATPSTKRSLTPMWQPETKFREKRATPLKFREKKIKIHKMWLKIRGRKVLKVTAPKNRQRKKGLLSHRHK